MAQRHKKIFLQVLFLVTTVIPVSSRVQLVVESFDSATVIFNETTFSEFFNCLCQLGSESCIVYYDDNSTAVSTERRESTNPYVWSSSYYCMNQYPVYQRYLIECRRMDYVYPISFSRSTGVRLLNTDSCDMDCIEFLWTGSLGVLDYDPESDNIKACQAELPRQNDKKQTPSETSTETDNESVLIVGLILGILLFVSLLVIGFLFWKLRRRENQDFIPHKSATPTSELSTRKTAMGVSAKSFRQLESPTTHENQPEMTSSDHEEPSQAVYEDPDGSSLDNQNSKLETGSRNNTESVYGNSPTLNVADNVRAVPKGTNKTEGEMPREDVKVEDCRDDGDYGNHNPDNNVQDAYSPLDEETFPSNHNYTALSADGEFDVQPTKAAQPAGDMYEDLSFA